MLRLLLLTIISTCVINCNNSPASTSPVNQAIQDSSVIETRLGKSNYFIQLPKDFKILEAKGVEGQLGYDLIPKDTSSTMYCFVEILHGEPINGGIPAIDSARIFRKSNLLSKQVEWKIIKTETGYFYVFTSEKGDLNSHVSSKNINEIDSLISIIETLKQKNVD